MRSIHIKDDQVWQYTIGNTGVKLVSPEGKSKFVQFHELLGWTPEQVAEIKEANMLAIKPSTIRNYLLGEKAVFPTEKYLQCDVCKKYGKDVVVTDDPYIEEIYNRREEVTACKDCLDAMAEEI